MEFKRERARTEREMLMKKNQSSPPKKMKTRGDEGRGRGGGEAMVEEEEEKKKAMTRYKKAVKHLKSKVERADREKELLTQIHEDEMRDLRESCRDEIERLSMQWIVKEKEIEQDRKELETQIIERDGMVEALQRENDELRRSVSTMSMSRSKFTSRTIPKTTGALRSSLVGTFPSSPATAPTTAFASKTDFIGRELERASEGVGRLFREFSPAKSASSSFPSTPSTKTKVQQKQKQESTTPRTPRVPQKPVSVASASPPVVKTTTTATTWLGESGMDKGEEGEEGEEEERAMAETNAKMARERAEREAQAMREIQEAMKAQKEEQEKQRRQFEEDQQKAKTAKQEE